MSSTAATPLPYSVSTKIHFFTTTTTQSLPICTPYILRFPPLTPKPPFKTFAKPLYNDTVHKEEYEEEEDVIGDCLVYEDGIFEDSFLPNNVETKIIDFSPEPENLIPDKWLEVQKEINITKKERRKLSQAFEYGRKVESRRRELMPINSKVFEKLKNEKLRELKPVVLDKPLEIKYMDDKKDDKGSVVEERKGRVAGRNPRLAVYGVGLEDISELFNSGRYEPSVGDDSKGPRKLFSKEEKLMLNKRIPDIAVATSGKWHPLHTLAATGEFYHVNSLLKFNLDINAPDKDGLTAIHKAILGKKQAVFNFLLRESANPFVRDEDGASLLHYAVFTASSQMIKILLLYNVDINLQDNDGWTALHLAIQSRRTDVVRLLLIKGADKTIKNKNGSTPLDLCLYSGRDTRTYELIRLLKRVPKT